MGFSPGIVAVLQHFIDAGYYLSVGWQVLGCFFLTASEVMISITCLEFAYTQAPKTTEVNFWGDGILFIDGFTW